MRKSHAVVFVILTSTVFLFWFAYSPQISSLENDSPYFHNRSIKTILLWNNFFEYRHMGQGVGHDIFLENYCLVTDCYIWDIADGVPKLPVEDFDLVWFHGIDIPHGKLLRTKPAVRKPHQRYLFYLLEAPSTFNFDLSPLDGFFNWTATYRRDSDIYHPYGIVKRKDTDVPDGPIWMEPSFENTTVTGNKTRLAAWLVSNCVKVPSNRDIYVEELSKHIAIDVFGACGQSCDRRCSEGELEKTYKFYLAFENSACQDYVTEKFFKIMKLNVVPVVFGGADYETVAPPMSYINANDYASPKELAKYLLYLDQNPNEYSKYFWWKKYYTVNDSMNIVCQVCEKLSVDKESSVKSDLDDWWNGDDVCHSGLNASLGTWLTRTVHYPGQMLSYTAVRLLSAGHVIVIALIVAMTVCLFPIVMITRHFIRKFCDHDRLSMSSQYWNLTKVYYK